MEILTFVLIILLAVAIFFLWKQNNFLKGERKKNKTSISTTMTKLRSVGELSVFQIYSKEVVTRRDSGLTGFWKNIFGWSMTQKQIAIIFEFEVNFIYDLRSEEFSIKELEEGVYRIYMPTCGYKYFIKDMKIYDEQNSKFLPFFLPDSINKIFGVSFSEEDKNRLIDEAKDEVKTMSLKIINELKSKIHKSATDTLETIAKSFGAKEVSFVFKDEEFLNIKDNRGQVSKAIIDAQA